MIRAAAVAAFHASKEDLGAGARARLGAVLEPGDVADKFDVAALTLVHYDDQLVVFGDESDGVYLAVTKRDGQWADVHIAELSGAGWQRRQKITSLAELGAVLLAGTLPPAPDPGPPTPWAAPTGAQTAYRSGQKVIHNGRVWASLTDANASAPGVAGWRDLGPVPPPPPPPPVEEPGAVLVWKQPTGAHDAYALGARVTHAGRTWESKVAGNSWEPGGPGIGTNIWAPVTP